MADGAEYILWLREDVAAARPTFCPGGIAWDGFEDAPSWFEAMLDEVVDLGFRYITWVSTETDRSMVLTLARERHLLCYIPVSNTYLGFAGIGQGNNACHGWQTNVKYTVSGPGETVDQYEQETVYDDEGNWDALAPYSANIAGFQTAETYRWGQVHSDYITALRNYTGRSDFNIIAQPTSDSTWWYETGVVETPRPFTAYQMYRADAEAFTALLATLTGSTYWPGTDGACPWAGRDGKGGIARMTYDQFVELYLAGFKNQILLYTDEDNEFWDWAQVPSVGVEAARKDYLVNTIVAANTRYGIPRRSWNTSDPGVPFPRSN